MQNRDFTIEQTVAETSAIGTAASTPLLEMRDVALRGALRETRLRRVNFEVQPGAMVLVKRSIGETKQLLGSAALGLVSPSRGQVMVNGIGWKKAGFRKRLEMRSRIGRVFDTDGWLLGLTVFDNIMLTERHHRDEDETSLASRVNQMAADFGISLPSRTPVNAEPWRLRICQWIRALLGHPKLIVLERPLKGVPAKYHESLIAAERSFRERGGGTLWITDKPEVLNHDALRDAIHLETRDQNLVPYHLGTT